MNLWSDIVARFWRVMDEAAGAALGLAQGFAGARKLQLVETATDLFEPRSASGKATFAGALRFVDGRLVEDPPSGVGSRLAGAEIEIVLAPPRFLFRTLELPEKAAGFLDGIVGGQIDRLTPWSAAQAAFGRGAPKPISGGRVAVTVAATSRARIAPIVIAAEAFKPEAIFVSAASEEAASPIVVLANQSNREARLPRLRARMVGVLAAAAAFAAAMLVAWVYLGDSLANSQDDVARAIVTRRAAIARARGFADDATTALAERKRQSAPTVVVIDKLSRALPDDTYLTGLKIGDGKVELSGATRQASALIKILEQTPGFKHAAFSAPTTQAPAEDIERFQIEAQLLPAALVTP